MTDASEGPDSERFLVQIKTGTGPQGPVIRELHIRPAPGNKHAGITARWLRTLKLTDYLDAQLTQEAEGAADDALRSLALVDETAPTELRIALTARAYLALIEAGHPRPSHALGEAVGLSIHGVRRRIAQARTLRLGLLSEAKAGEAGGHLTPKAKRLLQRHDQKEG